MKTFEFRGLRVYWSATYEDQQAWRCFKSSSGITIAIWVTQSHPGADHPQSQAALNLAQVVASAKQAR
jgi:hypothetical protein